MKNIEELIFKIVADINELGIAAKDKAPTDFDSCIIQGLIDDANQCINVVQDYVES